jgi:dephospho-CoA kinase
LSGASSGGAKSVNEPGEEASKDNRVITMHKQGRKPHPATGRKPGVPVIGLLGGVGSGKSLVAAQLRELGCRVVDADRVGHELLGEPEIRQAVFEHFGHIVMTRRGHVNRQRLAALAFSDPKELEALERIVHPELWRRVIALVERGRRGKAPAVVLDAALILEKGLDKLCTVMLYISAPIGMRRRRAWMFRGWQPRQVDRREAFQVSLKTKRNRADYIIDNSSTPEHTLVQVRNFLTTITK